MRSTIVLLALLLPSIALAQEAVAPLDGEWQDSYRTSFQISMCGDGTQLCAVLNDVQGDSRTEENLAYVGKQVMQMEQVAPNQWQGTVIFNGSEAQGQVTQTGDDTIEIQGCRGIICNTLVFNRV